MKACDMGVVYHNQPTHYVMYLFMYREDTGGNIENRMGIVMYTITLYYSHYAM